MSKLVYIVPDLTKCKIGESYQASDWYMIPEANKKFITSIAKGSEVEFQSSEEHGKKVLTFIKVAGETNNTTAPVKTVISNPTTATKSNGKPTCADCGVELKDDKYETCYKCSMARKEKEATSPEGHDKQRSIEVQAMIKAAANVVGQSVAGQINFTDQTQATKLAEFVVIVATKLLIEFDTLSKR